MNNIKVFDLFSLQVIDSELVPTDEEQKLLQFVEVVKSEPDDDEEPIKPAGKEQTKEQEVDNKEHATDANSELQAENQTLRNEVNRLKEENFQLRKTISMLEQQRDDSFHQRAFENDAIADLGFEIETVHVEKEVLQSEKQVLQSDIINKESEIGTFLVINDILKEQVEQKEEKIGELLDNIDDLETHNVTQEYKVR
jgi:chromosome segregation ATPase